MLNKCKKVERLAEAKLMLTSSNKKKISEQNKELQSKINISTVSEVQEHVLKDPNVKRKETTKTIAMKDNIKKKDKNSKCHFSSGLAGSRKRRWLCMCSYS